MTLLTQIAGMVGGTLALAMLYAMWRLMVRIAKTPTRLDEIEAENKKAHGDIWTKLHGLDAGLQRIELMMMQRGERR